MGQSFKSSCLDTEYLRMLLPSSLSMVLLLLATSALEPAFSKWVCPEHGLSFYGNDIEDHRNVATWKDCGRLCHENDACTHWTFSLPRGDHAKKNHCWLKDSAGGNKTLANRISGTSSCFN